MMNAVPKILMLGWEYPPHIAGGLGVACEGLTRALSARGVDIRFIVPKLLGGERAEHMQLNDSFQEPNTLSFSSSLRLVQTAHEAETPAVSSYATTAAPLGNYAWLSAVEEVSATFWSGRIVDEERSSIGKKSQYGSDVFEEVAKFTRRVVARYSQAQFDLIHAHDWMTYPAGVALAKLSGKPLVVHLHSSDFDRSGSSRNQGIYEIEAMGLKAAQAVIAVSHYTKIVVSREYGVPLSRIHVVHNGIYPKTVVRHYRKQLTGPGKLVLFLGRVTMQKGPDYFVRAAAKVIEHVPDVTFVMAGTGDLLPEMINLAHSLGIANRFHFPGFLNEAQVEEAFSQADLYVMPSVSEPFGISALEAITFDTPVLMSRQAGVGEVVKHSLKFDFWDVDRLADLIINGLIHPELRGEMIAQAKLELGKVRWEAAAHRTEEVYQSLL